MYVYKKNINIENVFEIYMEYIFKIGVNYFGFFFLIYV